MDQKIEIIFEDEVRNCTSRVSVSQGSTVLEALLASSIEIDHSCGGMGTCGTCRIFVENSGDLAERGEVEIELAKDRGFAPNERLACQTYSIPELLVIRR